MTDPTISITPMADALSPGEAPPPSDPFTSFKTDVVGVIRELETKESELRKRVMGLLIALVTAAILAGAGLILTNNKDSAVQTARHNALVKQVDMLSVQVGKLTDALNQLNNQVNVSTRDRWTRSEHDEYARDRKAEVDGGMRTLQSQITANMAQITELRHKLDLMKLKFEQLNKSQP